MSDSAALDYHRATDYAPGDWESQDSERYAGDRPPLFKDYGDAPRLPLETSVAGPLLQAAAGIVRSQEGRDYRGGTIHWRAYSSAGALYPVEAYVAAGDGLFSFDPLARSLVRLRGGDVRAEVAQAAAARELASAAAVVVVTGIHARTGWKYLERGYRHVWWDAGTLLANVLALAAADGLGPRLYTAFVDRTLNEVLGVDGAREVALAVVAVGGSGPAESNGAGRPVRLPADAGRSYPLADRLHAASSLADPAAVEAWRVPSVADEPTQPRELLERAIRRRRSVRAYARRPLPREEVRRVLAWSEGPIPADAPSVVRQLVTVAAVEGLEPGVYDARLALVREIEEGELRELSRFAAMEQDHPRLAAFNVWQMADLDRVVERLGDRGYRWAQLEAGIRAGRLQVGAFMRGWGAAASTFYDAEVSRLLETDEAPMLMVAVGPT